MMYTSFKNSILVVKKIVFLTTAAQDVVIVSDNPAYEQVPVKKIETNLKENPAYHTVHPSAVSSLYEDLTHFGLMSGHNVCSREKENPDYESVC